jgi:hypothetical protein
MRKLLLPLLIVAFLCFPWAVLAVETGSVAPDFNLKTTQGESVRLSDFKGRPIILKLATTGSPT